MGLGSLEAGVAGLLCLLELLKVEVTHCCISRYHEGDGFWYLLSVLGVALWGSRFCIPGFTPGRIFYILCCDDLSRFVSESGPNGSLDG